MLSSPTQDVCLLESETAGLVRHFGVAEDAYCICPFLGVPFFPVPGTH
jgi:hypothetical protein